MRWLPDRFEPLEVSVRRLMAEDPFLMAAAIAYNTIFALVPLSFAAVAAITLARPESDRLEQTEAIVAAGFPDYAADFMSSLMEDAQQAAGNMTAAVLVIALLIALWSGSRAIYATIKALRLVSGVDETRGYWKRRGLGILFTVAAGIALTIASTAVIFGGWAVDTLRSLGVHVGSAAWITTAALVGWVTVVLYAIYRWGPPEPTRRSMASAFVTTVILALTAWLASLIMPQINSGTLAALGTFGVVLLWSYTIGFVVITVPVVLAPLEDSLRGRER